MLGAADVRIKQLLSVSDTLPRGGGGWGGGVKGLFQWRLRGMDPPPQGWGWDFLGCWVYEPWNSGALKFLIYCLRYQAPVAQFSSDLEGS